MSWTVTANPTRFAPAVAPLLAARRAELTSIAGIVQRLIEVGLDAYGDGTPVLAYWTDPTSGEVNALAVHTPPRPMVLSALPHGASRELCDAVGPVHAAIGPEASAMELVAASGRTPRIVLRERLHRLTALGDC